MTTLEKAVEAVHSVERRKGDAFDVGDEMARDIARAVLLAVRQPGEGAVNAYFEKCRDLGFTAHINATCAMETMIDAILGPDA